MNYQNQNTSSISPEQTNHSDPSKVVLKVIGVGGAGNNAVQTMLSDRFTNVDFIVANTDAQALAGVNCEKKIKLGRDARGLGAGSDPKVGAIAARDVSQDILAELKGADIVIIAAGFGGGTGTGAAPVIAELAKSTGALTIGIITTPFSYEGSNRLKTAKLGLEELKNNVDAYMVLSNNKLFDLYGDLTVNDTWKIANISLKNIILALHDILYRCGDINIDFADTTKILKDAGLTVVGIGQATGKDRAIKAVDKAFEQHIYEHDIKTAKRVIINIQYDNKTTGREIHRAVNRIYEVLDQDPTDPDFECIVGQAAVETKDNAELFKVSIIAAAADENSKAQTVIVEDEEELKNNVEELLEGDKITGNASVDQTMETASTATTVEAENNNVDTNTTSEQQVQKEQIYVSFEEETTSNDSTSINENSNSKNNGITTKEIGSIFEIKNGKDEIDTSFFEPPTDDVDDSEDAPW